MHFTRADYTIKSTKSRNLKQHIKRIHEDMRYPCDQCDYIAKHSGNLKQHKESKH